MTFDALQDDLKSVLARVDHVVIKLGTGILTPHIEKNDAGFFSKLAAEIKLLRDAGKNVLIVSSGAVGYGKKIMQKEIASAQGYTKAEKQAFASLGQTLLIENYRVALQPFALEAAQILVSMLDFKSPEHFQHLKTTLDQLLSWNGVPVINENDAVTDLKFGDNDTLAALICGMYPESCLILLTTIDGFYFNDRKVDLLERVSSEEMNAAGDPGAGGSGGMRTKLEAARKILLSGQLMNIAPGDDPGIVSSIMRAEKIGTWFFHRAKGNLSARKRWVLHNRHVQGRIRVDEGAAEALRKSAASLLSVGVRELMKQRNAEPEFERGDLVDLFDLDGEIVGRGIVSLSSAEIASFLNAGKAPRGKEVIHRDNLVIMDHSNPAAMRQKTQGETDAVD